jgi:ATP-dependent RNA helicase DDX49/DBP8
MALPEDRVLERLNDVSAARRLANMVCQRRGSSADIRFSDQSRKELHDSNFGQREEVHRAKRRG